MLALAGYTITERVSEQRNVIVYRGYLASDADKKPLLFKLLKPVNAHPANRALVQSEYEIIKHIESDGIVKAYGITDSSAGMVLVSECLLMPWRASANFLVLSFSRYFFEKREK
jgi:hypothetical protein